tara:strand:+ start:4969 stop:5367 length:399 start_codon:yes stop_codon:yes gene_type:complete
MVKLDTNETAALSGALIEKIAKHNSVSTEDLLAQMVLRTVSETGAVYVDDRESPKSMMFVLLGHYGVLAEKTCVIMAAEADTGDYHAIWLAAKQFYKMNDCKFTLLGGYLGGGFEPLKALMDSPKHLNIYIQ